MLKVERSEHDSTLLSFILDMVMLGKGDRRARHITQSGKTYGILRTCLVIITRTPARRRFILPSSQSPILSIHHLCLCIRARLEYQAQRGTVSKFQASTWHRGENIPWPHGTRLDKLARKRRASTSLLGNCLRVPLPLARPAIQPLRNAIFARKKHRMTRFAFPLILRHPE